CLKGKVLSFIIGVTFVMFNRGNDTASIRQRQKNVISLIIYVTDRFKLKPFDPVKLRSDKNLFSPKEERPWQKKIINGIPLLTAENQILQIQGTIKLPSKREKPRKS